MRRTRRQRLGTSFVQFSSLWAALSQTGPLLFFHTLSAYCGIKEAPPFSALIAWMDHLLRKGVPAALFLAATMSSTFRGSESPVSREVSEGTTELIFCSDMDKRMPLITLGRQGARRGDRGRSCSNHLQSYLAVIIHSYTRSISYSPFSGLHPSL